MLDADLAEMYKVSTKVLNQAVKRNPDRFPEDFMFQLSKDEWEILKSQFVTSRVFKTTSEWGGRRTLPYVFTEQGVAMLSSVLNSPLAIPKESSLRCGGSPVALRGCRWRLPAGFRRNPRQPPDLLQSLSLPDRL